MLKASSRCRVRRFLGALLLPLALAACSSEEARVEDTTPSSPDAERDDTDPSGTAERAIAEADIVQVADGRLYAMSKSGSVAVVDISVPGRLALLGKTRLPGEPFEMYRRGDLLVTMSNAAFEADGNVVAFEDESRPPRYRPDASSAVIVLDVSSPATIRTVATHVVPGLIDDSRVVGDVLYLVTHENGSCWRCERTDQTRVTSFAMGDAIGLPKVDEVVFSALPGTYGGAKRSVTAGKDRLYVGGTSGSAGVIDVLDVTSPQGVIGRGAHLAVPGPVYTRWQVDEHDGVLRVISQPGAHGSSNGTAMPSIDTFRIESARSIRPLGHGTLELPIQEGLRGVRFDGERAYAITYRRTDPLFTIDLSNPAAPRQRGELVIPGFVFHLEPHGDRVLGLGVDASDPAGDLNVSLFDVADLDRPTMLTRVAFGSKGQRNDDNVANVALAEDHDRIQKAFKVLDDGLVVVPFSGTTSKRGTGDTCDSVDSGVQLIEWKDDSLTKRALLPLRGNPRRALQNQNELVTVSDSNVRTFSLANRDEAEPTADVVIGTCVSRYASETRACAIRAPGGGARTQTTASMGALLGVLALAAVRRRGGRRPTGR